LIEALEVSDVPIILDSNTSKLIGELMSAMRKEVGLGYRAGQFYLRLGEKASIRAAGFEYFIGHGHPSGNIILSVGDIAIMSNKTTYAGHAIFDAKGFFRIFNKEGLGGRIMIPIKDLANTKRMAESEIQLIKRMKSHGY